MDNAMAPKAPRHLAQGKRKRSNQRRPQSTPASVVGEPDATTANIEPGTTGDHSTEATGTPKAVISHQAPASVQRPRRAVAAQKPGTFQSRKRKSVASQSESQRATSLPRELEYAFIRADMRRLLLTAGTLTILMLLLLFFIER